MHSFNLTLIPALGEHRQVDLCEIKASQELQSYAVRFYPKRERGEGEGRREGGRERKEGKDEGPFIKQLMRGKCCCFCSGL